MLEKKFIKIFYLTIIVFFIAQVSLNRIFLTRIRNYEELLFVQLSSFMDILNFHYFDQFLRNMLLNLKITFFESILYKAKNFFIFIEIVVYGRCTVYFSENLDAYLLMPKH